MILRVILKNFLSFNDEVQFDMFPNMKRTTLSNHITMLNEKLPVLKMAAIYGANGAGKSNLLKGINFLKAIALNKSFLDKDTFGKYIFALKENTGTEPMELTIEFETKNRNSIYILCGNYEYWDCFRNTTDFRFGFGRKTIMFSLAKRAKSNMQLRLQRK